MGFCRNLHGGGPRESGRMAPSAVGDIGRWEGRANAGVYPRASVHGGIYADSWFCITDRKVHNGR
jgi:hypothetical protein